MYKLLIRDSDTPLYLQICNFFKREILEGNINCGAKLPSIRILANKLAVSKNTIETAYQQLIAEGFAVSMPKSGFYVSYQIPPCKNTFDQQSLSKGENLRTSTEIYDFSYGRLNISDFPASYLKRFNCMNYQEEDDFQLRRDPQGEYGLRLEIAKYLHFYRGVKCIPEQIVVCSGTQHTLSIICQLIGENQSIAVENPCYDAARHIFQNYHYKIFPINLTCDGLDMNELNNSKCSVVYTTPSRQFPCGITMSLDNRKKLLDWACKNKAWIIEDDYDGAFNNKNNLPLSLQGMDNHENVIYVGTFSKSLVPIIQMSYMVLPMELLQVFFRKFKFVKQLIPIYQQNAIKEFISSGNWIRHIMKVEKIYKNKMNTLLSGIKEIESKTVRIINHNSPLHLLVEIIGCNEQNFINYAYSNNIIIYSTYKYWSIPPIHPIFLIGFGNMNEEQLKKGISLFNKVCLQKL
jgi:GntR family transcriptional regulator/MocR family aminotransferase